MTRTPRSIPSASARSARAGSDPVEKRPGESGRAGSAETRAAILDAAESLFIEMGYVGSSLRAIASRAGVNLASAHYHFGSKAGLLGAVVHARVGPINDERARGLARLLRENPNPDVESILAVFVAPLANDGAPEKLPRLIARLYGEPEAVARPLLEREFGPTARRFLAALESALPAVAPAVVAARFHFVVGAMVHMLSFEHLPGVERRGLSNADRLAELVAFSASGMTRATRGGRG